MKCILLIILVQVKHIPVHVDQRNTVRNAILQPGDIENHKGLFHLCTIQYPRTAYARKIVFWRAMYIGKSKTYLRPN